MSVDLSQFRGKRALVCGIPRDGAKTYQAWRDAVDKARQLLGADEAAWITPWSAEHVARGFKTYRADFVLVGHPRNLSYIREGAKRAGVPVLRVRRDGSVEVDDG